VLDGIAQNHQSNMVVVRYHCWWPSASDPFYTANPTENAARVNYYGADYTPHAYIDGLIDAGYQTGSWDNLATQRASVSSPLTIELSGYYLRGSRTGNIRAHITNTSTGTVTGVVQFGVWESRCRFSAPNGETIHNNLMRDMLPTATGQAISIPPFSSVDTSRAFTVSSSWNADTCYAVCFVQNNSTKEIYQSGKVWVRDLPNTGVETAPIERPMDFVSLSAAEPTPFKSSTRISYGLPSEGPVSLSVFNFLGARMKTLISGTRPAGSHSVVWDGRDNRGTRVPGGVYFFELKTPYKTLTTRTVVVR